MDLQRLFSPESVAVVGASPHLGGGKMPYYQIFQMAGYKGRLYPVNPKYTEISGVKVYPTLDDIPEPVDLAIVGVPAGKALETVEAAARKGIKFIHFFTSGFSEIGNVELEKAMLKAAHKGGTRIIGPNCIGVHCTGSAVTCDVPKSPLTGIGKVAFLGQSGGMTHNFMRMANSRKLELNKVVSYGNQIDLKVEDYLEYLADDDTVRVIAAYIEDIKNGRRFIEALKKTTAKKPVVILKGGITEQGARAAASHTGAMAASHEIWTAVMRQNHGIEAVNFEQMVDLTMMSLRLHPGSREDTGRVQTRLPGCRRRDIRALHRYILSGRFIASGALRWSPKAYQRAHKQREHQHHEPRGSWVLRLRFHHHGPYHRGHGPR